MLTFFLWEVEAAAHRTVPMVVAEEAAEVLSTKHHRLRLLEIMVLLSVEAVFMATVAQLQWTDRRLLPAEDTVDLIV
jgi:hypothetical protein